MPDDRSPMRLRPHLAALALLLACRTGVPTALPYAYLVQAVAGDSQSVIPDSTSAPIRLRVLDMDSTPVAGVPVQWTVAVPAAGSVIPVADTTDANGLAGTWYHAGPYHGWYTVTGRVGAEDSLRFVVHIDTLPSPAKVCATTPLAADAPAIDAALTPSSCTFDAFWTTMPSDRYAVDLVAGQAYLIRMTHRPDPLHAAADDVDPFLLLYDSAGGSAQYLGMSDDEGGDGGLKGGNGNSELILVAPSTGTHYLAAASRFSTGYGGYELAMQTCPVIPAAVDSGPRTYTLPKSGCYRHHPGTGVEGTPIAFLTVPIAFQEQVEVDFASGALTPYWDVFQDLDAYGNLGGGAAIGQGDPSWGTVTGVADGRLTIALGGGPGDSTGAIVVHIGRTAAAAPPVLAGRLPFTPPLP